MLYTIIYAGFLPETYCILCLYKRKICPLHSLWSWKGRMVFNRNMKMWIFSTLVVVFPHTANVYHKYIPLIFIVLWVFMLLVCVLLTNKKINSKQKTTKIAWNSHSSVNERAVSWCWYYFCHYPYSPKKWPLRRERHSSSTHRRKRLNKKTEGLKARWPMRTGRPLSEPL